MGRKLEAKLRPEEHEPHTRRLVRWARGHKDSKPGATRISQAYMRRVCGAKVTRLTPGDLFVCQWLGSSRGEPMDVQKSAEAIVAARTAVKGQT